MYSSVWDHSLSFLASSKVYNVHSSRRNNSNKPSPYWLWSRIQIPRNHKHSCDMVSIRFIAFRSFEWFCFALIFEEDPDEPVPTWCGILNRTTDWYAPATTDTKLIPLIMTCEVFQTGHISTDVDIILELEGEVGHFSILNVSMDRTLIDDVISHRHFGISFQGWI